MFNKLFFLSLLLGTVPAGLWAQQQAAFRNSGDKQEADVCRYAVTYTYRFVEDTLKKDPLYDRYVLEIGDRMSRFYSVYADQCDSIMFGATRGSHRGSERGVDAHSWLRGNERATYDDFFMHHPQPGMLTVSSCMINMEYAYTEAIPSIEWHILPDTLTVMGYVCQKATAVFRGRQWDVWFSLSLPFGSGPWKFSGLPGLVLRAEDRDRLFEFEAIGLERTADRKIHVWTENQNRYRKISRQDMMKLVRQKWEDPAGLIISHRLRHVVVDAQGRARETQSGDYRYPYIPALELE